MAITFELELTLASGAFPVVQHEPNNDLYQYHISDDSLEEDLKSEPAAGHYDALSWSPVLHSLATRAVSRIGAKNFPHIGAIGFYKDKYTSQSSVLAPIHADYEEYNPPTIAVEVSGSITTVTITPPTDITYTCYKVIMRSGYFAFEYVVYDLEKDLPTPTVIGNYDVYAIGYNETTGTASSWSNAVEISIASGDTNWDPAALTVPMSLADLTDVSIVDLLNAQAIRYNSTTQKWENVTP